MTSGTALSPGTLTMAIRHSWSTMAGVHVKGPIRADAPGAIAAPRASSPTGVKSRGQIIPVPGLQRSTLTRAVPAGAASVPRFPTRTWM